MSVDTEWTICWYLCRSDLESEFGAATNDLVEMMRCSCRNREGGHPDRRLSRLANDAISAETLGRYVYDHNGLQRIEDSPPPAWATRRR